MAATVSMSGEEYIGYYKDHEWRKKMTEGILGAFEVHKDVNGRLTPNLRIGWFLSEELAELVAKQVIETLLADEEMLKRLWQENDTVMDLYNGYFKGNWGHPEAWEFDLAEDPRIARKFAEWEEEKKLAEEAETEDEEDAE